MTWEQALAEAVPMDRAVLAQAYLPLTPEPCNVGVARKFVTSLVQESCRDCLDVAQLLTSELITNAVIHARTRLDVAVVVTTCVVVVLVHDEDVGRREIVLHERDGGRGLELVRALAATSGVTHHPGGGKTAWFTLATDIAPHGMSV